MKKISILLTLQVFTIGLLFSSCSVEGIQEYINPLSQTNSTKESKVNTTDNTTKTDIVNTTDNTTKTDIVNTTDNTTKTDMVNITDNTSKTDIINTNVNVNPTVNYIFNTITFLSGELGQNIVDPCYKLWGNQIGEINNILSNSGDWTEAYDLPQSSLVNAYVISDKYDNSVTLFLYHDKTAIIFSHTDDSTPTNYYALKDLYENVKNFMTANFSDDENKDNTTGDSNVVYINDEYGFNVDLPDNWEGYTIVNDTWEGIDFMGNRDITKTGPIIYIRHPLWTNENPRQDIPIMVFTFDQWNGMYNDEFHIGTAPVNPRELTRNSKYIFALPARYNFANLVGVEEVQDIIDSKPVVATENISMIK